MHAMVLIQLQWKIIGTSDVSDLIFQVVIWRKTIIKLY